MAAYLHCRNGHKWSDPSASDATTSEMTNNCPHCGAPPISAPEFSASEAKTKEMTLDDESQSADARDMTSASVAEPFNASDQTGPTVAARESDQIESGRTENLSVEASQEGATLSLSPSEGGVEEHTEDGGNIADDASDRTQREMDDIVSRDNTMDETEATELGRATAGKVPAGATGRKRAAAGPTTIRRGKAAKLPSRIAGYEILGELGRGGMGVVYKARQSGLNRLCALKMILGGGLASAETINRFKVEAEAIAHLQHPNIVQVYEIGKAEDCPYFSLEFVEGSNLQAKIAGTPQPPQETASMMQKICEGVHAAHLRGVLHRDLKPANILLTKTNEPKITDFGLAKRLEEKDHGQTRTGAILGTPSYMAPEQAMGRAKDVGAAADVYSLGAVLYDMLTGRPPFRGETVMDTLNQVQKMEPLAPRNLAPKVPLDLQTICLKALQKDPKKRYVTAGDMAEDLRRYQAGEPILARPIPAWERGVKWAKRRPALATTISVTTVAIITVLTVGGLWLNTARVAANEREVDARILADAKSEALREETKLKEMADKHFNQARQFAKKTMGRVNRTEFRYEPGMEVFRRDMAKQAMDYYLELLKDRDNPAMKALTAESEFQLAIVYRDLGRLDESLNGFQTAWNKYAELEREKPGDEDYRTGMAGAIMERAYTLQLQNKYAESEKDYQQALELFGKLAKQHPDNPIYRDEVASIYDNLGTICQTFGRLKEAETDYAEALNIRKALTGKGEEQVEYQKRLARLQGNYAALLLKVGKADDAEKHFLASRDVAKALSDAKPEVPDYAYDWADSNMNLGIYYRKMQKPQLAVAPMREAIDLLDALKSDYPRTPVFRQELARADYELGLVLGTQGKLEEARDSFTDALKIQEQLLVKQSKQPALQLQLAQSHISLGIALVQLGDLDEAASHYRKGVDVLERAKPAPATAPEECNELARGYQNLAFLLPKLTPPVDAGPTWDCLLLLRQDMANAFPESLDKQTDLANVHLLLANRFKQADKSPEAIANFKDAASILSKCMGLVDKDSTRSEKDRKELSKSFADNTILILQQAVGVGFNDANYLKTAPEFEPMRMRPEFQRLIAQLEKK